MNKPIRTDGNEIELILVHPVYVTRTITPATEDAEAVTETVLQKELKVRRWFTKDSIVSIQEHVTDKNKISKKRCLIYDRYTNQFYECFHSVEQVREAKRNSEKPRVGFAINKQTNN